LCLNLLSSGPSVNKAAEVKKLSQRSAHHDRQVLSTIHDNDVCMYFKLSAQTTLVLFSQAVQPHEVHS
jgi:hypothetical protein